LFNISKGHSQSKSVTAMAGKLLASAWIQDTHELPRTAYEGQSGSKDRGDPQVYCVNQSIMSCVHAHAHIDIEFIRRQPPTECH
jgi:hypothetical protein